MLKIRLSRDRLIFNMVIPIPGKDVLYIEAGPWICNSITIKQWGVNDHGGSKFNSGLEKPPLQWNHEQVTSQQMKQWMWFSRNDGPWKIIIIHVHQSPKNHSSVTICTICMSLVFKTVTIGIMMLSKHVYISAYRRDYTGSGGWYRISEKSEKLGRIWFYDELRCSLQQ